MASQTFITIAETSIIGLTPLIQNTSHALELECQSSGNGKPYTENYDVWGTLAVNARVVAKELLALADRIGQKDR